jgi:Fic-DOC domain mobile mystery protein B
MSSKTTLKGATSGTDISGLKVTAQSPGEINEFEAANIAEATEWAYKSRKLRNELLTGSGLLELHDRMYGKVWDWAGQFRKEDLNIGVNAHQIQNELGQLLGDVNYWLENKTYSLDEICMRFHHGLTRIHPFKNGNGRLARLAANLLSKHNGNEIFTWGSVNLIDQSPDRQRYIQTLKTADETTDVSALLKFARS